MILRWLLLATLLVSIHCFSFARRMQKPSVDRDRQQKPSAETIITKYLNPNEVYLGNLPTSFGESEILDVLQSKGITQYTSVTVSSYRSRKDLQYCVIKFGSNDLAMLTISALQGGYVNGQVVDVSLMPTVSRVTCYSKFRNGLNPYQKNCMLEAVEPLKDNIKMDFREKNRVTKGVYLNCGSPAIAAWVYHRLSALGELCVNYYLDAIREYCLAINNLDHSITNERIDAILTSVLGDNQYLSANVTQSLIGTPIGIAYVSFASQEQMDRAMKILNECKVMDRQLRTVDRDRLSKNVQMYLGNVDPHETEENIAAMCYEVTGDEGAVIFVRKNYGRVSGNPLPSCVVYFDSDLAMLKCKAAIEGKILNTKKLTTVPKREARAHYTLIVKNICMTESKEKVAFELQKLVDPIVIRSLTWGFGSNRPYIFLEFAKEEEAEVALSVLNGAVFMDGVLFASKAHSFGEVTNRGSLHAGQVYEEEVVDDSVPVVM